MQGDVSKLADLDRLYEAVRKEKGRVDIVFANTGTAEFAALGSITEEHYDKTFDANVKGLLFTVQKALPLMPQGASIILNASVVSIKASPALSVYSATKAAIRAFARNWTLDLKDREIRVNVVSPGPIETPGFDTLGVYLCHSTSELVCQVTATQVNVKCGCLKTSMPCERRDFVNVPVRARQIGQT